MPTPKEAIIEFIKRDVERVRRGQFLACMECEYYPCDTDNNADYCPARKDKERGHDKYRDEYERIKLTKEPATAVEILVMLCREKDKRIADLKTEIQWILVKKELQ